MKVSLNVREHVTRKYRKAKSTEPAGTIYVLRYGNTFETIDAENWNDARVAQLRKSAALLEGWLTSSRTSFVRSFETAQKTHLVLVLLKRSSATTVIA